MYLYARSIDFDYFYDFPVGFSKCTYIEIFITYTPAEPTSLPAGMKYYWKRLKIPNGQPEAVMQTTDNTMVKRKRTKIHRMIHKTHI